MARNKYAVLPIVSATCMCGEVAHGGLTVLQEMGWKIVSYGYLSCPTCEGDPVKAAQFWTGWEAPPSDRPLEL